MSSFQKTGTTAALQLSGTKLRNGLPCISSGVPSLDHIIGGSVPVGSLFMIEEDVLRNYSRVIAKFFLAEGVVCKHALLVASLDDDPNEMLKELPSPTSGELENDLSEVNSENEKMKIAWRYESQGTVESAFGSNTNFGHHFDLSRHIDGETLKNCDISCWSNLALNKKCEGFHNPLYHDLLKMISDHVKKKEYWPSSQAQNVLRVCISSLGSPLWSAHEAEDGFNPNHCGQDIAKFMYCLRIMLRGTTAVALVTVPTHLFEDESLVKRLLNSADNAVRLESFAGSERETNPAFREFHGLLYVSKLSASHSLVPHLPPADLAFKLRRKRFLAEKLHSIPIHVEPRRCQDEPLVKRLLNSADNAVRLESFAGSERETNPAFREYHGLLYVSKLSASHSLVPHLPPADLAFKLRRKRFLVEKLHLPPELQESSEREQDDVTAVAPSCGGFKKKDIDF